MENIEVWEIAGGVLEYIDETHTYIYNGEILPSITQVMQMKFKNKYYGISKEVLQRASERGSRIHKSIEDYEKSGIEDAECTELRNYKFLKKTFKFDCIDSEVPIVIFKDGKAVACGRLDLVLKENNEIGLGDIKTTSTLDKEYLKYQLNLYRIGYEQCYGTKIAFLRGVHLKNDTRKYISIPIDESLAMGLLNDYLGGVEK